MLTLFPGLAQPVEITNYVLNQDGSAASSTVVYLYRDGSFCKATVTDASGMYKFSSLIAGDYKVKVFLKDGSDNLWVDYSTASSVISGPFSSSITVPASLTVTTSGSSTTVSISSSGSKYSYYAPPIVTTPDGYVGKGLVDFATGALTGLTTLASGTGSATTASLLTLGENTAAFTNVSKGIVTGEDNGLDFYYAYYSVAQQGTDASAALVEKITARIGGAYPPWSYPNANINASAWAKMYDLLFNNGTKWIDLGNGSAGFYRCIAWYPSGSYTVYYNGDPSVLSGLLGVDGYSLDSYTWGSGVQGYAKFTTWTCVLVDRSAYAHPISSNPPGGMAWNEYPPPDMGCGVRASYDDYAQAVAAAKLRNTAYNRAQQGKLPIKNNLPAIVQSALNALGISGELQGFIRYLNNYSTYSALENVADARYNQQVADARALYGEPSQAFENAKASAQTELNAAKGYFANEFMVKPMLETLADFIAGGNSGTDQSFIDYLRGVPGGTTRDQVYTGLSALVTDAFNGYYQIVESPWASLLVGAAMVYSGSPISGFGIMLGGASMGLSGSNDSPLKSLSDFIDQSTGVFQQPSWLNGQSYDTFDFFSKNGLEGAGKRVTFSGSGYTSSQIAAPDDAALPYVWNSATGKYTTNP